jgi:hypothetical protein
MDHMVQQALGGDHDAQQHADPQRPHTVVLVSRDAAQIWAMHQLGGDHEVLSQ